MDDTTMMRTWWDEKANLDLERLSNQDWRDERLSFYYPFYNERLFPLANPVKPRWIPSLYPCQEIALYTMWDYSHLLTLLSLDEFLLYTHAKGLPHILGACY